MHDESARDGFSSMIDTLRALFYAPAAATGAAVPPLGVPAEGRGTAGAARHRDDADATLPRARRLSFADIPRRIQAPVVCRPAGLRIFAPADRKDERVRTVALFSDAPLRVGERFELEVFANGESCVFTAKVSGIDALPEGHRARFDVLFEVTRIDTRTADALVGLLA
jgi:hypothetical protein